jgi:hypothetical protein
MSKATDLTTRKDVKAEALKAEESAQAIADLEPKDEADVVGGCMFCDDPSHNPW